MKKFFAMLLICSVLASVTACGGGSSPSKSNESNSSESSAVSKNEPVTLDIFIDHSWYAVEKFTGIIPEEITKRTGVTLNPTIAIDDKQLGIMIASGELPDLVYTQNSIDRMSNSKLSYSYEELLQKYNTGWTPSDKQLGIGRGFSSDGIAYTILNHYSEKKDWENVSSVPMVSSLTYRKDLWEDIGSPKMESFDDLFNIMGQVKSKYPDMVPLNLTENWNTLVLRNLIGMGAVDYIEQPDSSYIHYTKDPRYKEVLMWLNKAYRSGFISADDAFFIKGSTAIARDKYFFGCICTQNGIPTPNAELAAINPKYVFAEMVPFKDSSFITSDVGWSATFITKNNKNPEASIKLMSWMFSPEGQAITQMGREGIEYTLNVEGLPVFSEEWNQSIKDDTQKTKYNPWFYLGGSEIVEANSRCATLDPALVADTYKVVREKFDNYPWVIASNPLAETDEKVIFEKIKELVKTYEAKVILSNSESSAEEAYNEYLKNASRSGMETLEKYMSKKINENKELYK